MPVYEYKCPKCEKNQELILPFNHDAPKCPDCGEPMKVKFGNYAIHMRIK